MVTMRIDRFGFLLSAAHLFITLLTVGAIRDDVPDAHYLALAEEPQFDSVGLILKDDEPNASAVLVETQWALTAGHEVYDQEPASFSVRFGNSTYPVEEILSYPDYEHTGVLGHNGDLALLRLGGAVDGVEPAILYRGDQEQGRVGTTVGYGRSGSGASIITSPTPVGTKRAGQNMIDGIGAIVDGRDIPDDLLISDFDHPRDSTLNRIGDAEPLDLEYCPVGGDSGGGVFIEEDGSWYLAGIVSAFTPQINDDMSLGLAGSLIYWSRVSMYADWIDSVIEPESR